MMEAQSSSGFAQVVEPNLWYGDHTRLTPKQEEASLGFSRACGSGIPAYICTMKKLTLSRDRWHSQESSVSDTYSIVWVPMGMRPKFLQAETYSAVSSTSQWSMEN